MISIIISSYQDKFFLALEKNIAETIGVNYEIIKIHNPGLLDIAKAYNLGALKANYEYLLYIHEDVLFITNNWGKELINCFLNDKVGLVGVAGNKKYGFIPVGWWQYDPKNLCFNILQHTKKNELPIHIKSNFNRDYERVKVVDGVFIAARKSHKIFFNENIKGFHSYDLAFSLNIYKNGLSAVVTNRILIEHFSPGNKNKEFYSSLLKFVGLYKTELQKIDKKPNLYAVEELKKNIIILFQLKEYILAVKFWLFFFRIKPFSKFNSWLILYIFNIVK